MSEDEEVFKGDDDDITHFQQLATHMSILYSERDHLKEIHPQFPKGWKGLLSQLQASAPPQRGAGKSTTEQVSVKTLLRSSKLWNCFCLKTRAAYDAVMVGQKLC